MKTIAIVSVKDANYKGIKVRTAFIRLYEMKLSIDQINWSAREELTRNALGNPLHHDYLNLSPQSFQIPLSVSSLMEELKDNSIINTADLVMFYFQKVPLSKAPFFNYTRKAHSLDNIYGGYSTHALPTRNAEKMAERIAETSRSRNVPKYVLEKAEFFEKEKGYPTDYAFAMAWSIWCKYKDPKSKHCKKDTSTYLKGKKK
jgi:hypothetical protein